MPKNLVIVESPAKAKTIEGYLGKDYKVVSSYGHVRDLPKGDTAINIDEGFKPTYEISPDKKEVIKELKKLSKDAEMVFLASDDDREGEAISWHLMEALDLNDAQTRRIVFREITKNAIDNALKTPRGINIDLVNAQQARRVLDRLVGYELSPILWKKIKAGLSAGRVQSVAVRFVVEREREIDQFKPDSFFKVSAVFIVEKGKELKAEISHRFPIEEEARAFLENCIGAEFHIKDLQKKPAKKTPAPPFTTSTLQQEASRKLGYSVSKTMTMAQKLYEAGKISYMRTDSVNLSQEAIGSATAQIKRAYGDNYVKVRKYKTKSSGAQEAHEAIRPTDFSTLNAGLDSGSQRLYDLIWKRAVASQMADAALEKTNVSIAVIKDGEENQYHFSATGEVVKFDGFLKVYFESTDDDEDNAGTPTTTKDILPPLTVGQELDLHMLTGREGFSRPPARYTEASLVKKLEEMGIGRPSTYAPTISTIQKRNYVIKESREGKERNYRVLSLEDGKIEGETKTEITGSEKNKLFPTNIAMVVNDFLVEHFPNVTNYSFTAEVEEEFDQIAQGMKAWEQMISDFYTKFHSKVEDTEQIERKDVKSARELGVDPKTGKKVYARLGRFGPLVQLGETEGEEKPKYAPLRKDQFIESISLEEALDLFKLPREIGEFDGAEMTVGIGRFGPYIRHNNKFVSIPKEDDPYSITAERAVELIKAKREQEANKIIKEFSERPDIQVLNGRYGPYIKAGKKNVKIPKDKKPEELSLEECVELANAAPEKKKGRGRKKK